MRPRRGQIGGIVRARDQAGQRPDYAAAQNFLGARVRRRYPTRDSFLQQQFCSLGRGIVVETNRHDRAVEQIVERDQAHTLMMGHECTYDRAAFALLHALGGIVERLVKAIA